MSQLLLSPIVASQTFAPNKHRSARFAHRVFTSFTSKQLLFLINAFFTKTRPEQCIYVKMNVVPRSTLNRKLNWSVNESAMWNPWKIHSALALVKGIREPHKVNKFFLTSVGIEPTTSRLDLPLLCRLSYERGRTEKIGDDLKTTNNLVILYCINLNSAGEEVTISVAMRHVQCWQPYTKVTTSLKNTLLSVLMYRN